ncbi:heterokaryon incompatibility protein-domain-containing protein [Astrocystis sublimbata]|nr:heterokaryon incompatibility protein-domain-containing protein [Astrocystis sublimbata]
MGYSYKPLPYGNRARYIRLVSLLAGSGDLQLQFHSEATSLSENDAEPYEALSYVWGSKDNPVEVKIVGDPGTTECNNEPHEQTMSITQNLATALQYLRYEDDARVLWIDAVCIDQSNVTEKGHQVALMGEVYKHAKQVIVWLGPPADHSGRALEVLREIGSQVTVDWTKTAMSPTPDASDKTLGLREKGFPSYFTADDASAVEALWARAWFERVWVRQEVALGRSATFQAGRDSLDRVLMQNAAYCIYHKDTESPVFTGNSQGATVIEGSNSRPANEVSPLSRLTGGARVSLVQLMCEPPYRFFPLWLHYYLEGMHCGDPRDRVYGMLSLLSGLDNEQSDFVPDYLAPVTNCYRDLALRHIAAERSLDILASCSLSYKTVATAQYQPERTTPLPGLPSWVPDWSADMDRHTAPVPIMGGRPFLAFTEYRGDGVLRVLGVSCGTVSAAHVLDVYSSTIALFQSLWTACQHLGIPLAQPTGQKNNNPPTGETWAAYLAGVLGMDRYYESFEPPGSVTISAHSTARTIDRILSMQNANFTLQSISPEGSDDPDLDMTVMERKIRGIAAGRKLFRTSEGHVGLGPASMQPNDNVCLLLGSQFLIILRPRSSGIPGPGAQSKESSAVEITDESLTSFRTRQQFVVVGECYVSGLMAGETLLGPLPPYLRLKLCVVDGQDERQICLVDARTGEATLRDPQIQALEYRLSVALGEKGVKEAVSIRPSDEISGEQGELRYLLEPGYFNMLGIRMSSFDLI